MAGATKHIFDHDVRDIIGMLNKQLADIKHVLPRTYSTEDIINLLKYYFPHEWFSIEMKYLYYTKKDVFLKKRFGKSRYNMKRPGHLVKCVGLYKKIVSPEFKAKHMNEFSEEIMLKKRSALWSIRAHKIEKINKKISNAKLKVQQVTPEYIDQIFGLYERKTTSQKDKVYLLAELKKYYSPKIIQFFYKLNDTELNKQLRQEAFYHLQSFNYQPRLRRQKYMKVHAGNSKRKEFLKKVYPDQKFSIIQTPQELEYRIENAKEQQLKKYDYFLSHSSKDRELVQKLIQFQNKQGKDVFCDWINDIDYLKRHLLCDATLKVIEKRLEQSDALLFVKSEYSMTSIWCKYELNFYLELGRPIYTIAVEDINSDKFAVMLENDRWFFEPSYKALALFEGTKIVA